MTELSNVRLRCPHCASEFAPPLPPATQEELHAMLEWGGIIDCRHCHRFIVVDEASLRYNIRPATLHCRLVS